MKPCRKMPERWNAWGMWENRWHALFCPECRAARAVDRKLAREVCASRRDPVPPGLDARLLESLGLTAGSAPVRGTRSVPVSIRPAGTPFLAAAYGAAGAVLITALLVLPNGSRRPGQPDVAGLACPAWVGGPELGCRHRR